MAIIKCKMCGGDLDLVEGASTAECEYCGSVQTVPKVDDEKKLTLFARANRLRVACEFDKATGIYESIVADFPEEAEAYWGLVLCKYGIEYVDDPATGKKIPTCHRSSFDSIMEDSDFEQALENADAVARKVYREEAKTIEEIRKGIIAVSNNEQPYDIFICYKETAENGDRTLDSVLAQDVYDALTGKGYRVFFSRITLEDKLGMEYEPYIFAALNSAKIMLTFGTDYEYFNAVWVKNEWSRFLKLMAKDKEKHLIPCFKGIDAYDMPKEFARLQAQDLGKVGAIQDLLRGIEKILPRQTETVKETVVVQQPAVGSNPTVDSYLKRAFMFLEDGDWKSADEYCEKVLDIDPENAPAYVGKLMVELQVHKQEELNEQDAPFDSNNNYQKAVRFGDDKLKTELIRYTENIIARIEEQRIAEEKRAEELRKDTIYKRAITKMNITGITGCEEAIKMLQSISGWKDADAQAEICSRKLLRLKEQKNDGIYNTAVARSHGKKAADLKEAIILFQSIPGWKDADEQVAVCKRRQQELEEEERIAQQAQEEELRKQQEATKQRLLAVRQRLQPAQAMISTMHNHTAALCSDGTVRVAGGRNGGRYVNTRSAIAVTVGMYHTVALNSNGEVVATGADYWGDIDGQRNVGSWTNIVAIATGSKHTVGLRADGTVVATGENEKGQCNVSDWKDIVAVAAGEYLTIGLKADGTVVTTPSSNMMHWKDIVAVAPPVGLKADGTVVTTESKWQNEVSKWRDIVSIAVGDYYVVGLKADGTVVAAGQNVSGGSDVQNWHDIVAIDAGEFHTIGLQVDGQVVITKYSGKKIGYSDISHEVSQWKLFSDIDTIEQERKAAQWKYAGLCQHCGGELKGLFSKKCVSCGKPKDY